MIESRVVESLFSETLYDVSPKPTIIITRPWRELTSEEHGQLNKITEALRQRLNPKLGLEAFRVVYQQVLDLNAIAEKPEHMIYFGAPVKGLANYEVVEVGGTKIVLSESLTDLVPNEQSRTRLWSALKQLFEGY